MESLTTSTLSTNFFPGDGSGFPRFCVVEAPLRLRTGFRKLLVVQVGPKEMGKWSYLGPYKWTLKNGILCFFSPRNKWSYFILILNGR